MTLSATSTMSYNAAQLGLPDIAFVGRAGAGKTTASKFLGQLKYERLSFADPLREVAERIWGSESVDRDKLQKLGVAVRRIDEDAWLHLMLERIRKVRDPWAKSDSGLMSVPRPPMVVDDCRFPNEWWALKGEGFTFVRITAARATRIDRLKRNGKWQDESQLEHESETAIDHLDANYVIENNDTIDVLHDDIVDILLKERRKR
jgi:dephospho-CoA kinase